MKKMTYYACLFIVIVAGICMVMPLLDTAEYLACWYINIRPDLPAGSVPHLELLNSATYLAGSIGIMFMGLIGVKTFK